VAGVAGMGIRIASWYRPAKDSAITDDGYTTAVHEWMHKDFTVTEIAHTYTEYAIALLRTKT
jgi:putative NIF3 family GTP cyclohydrolase 1 type 2